MNAHGFRTVPNQFSLVMSIPHQDVVVDVRADYGPTYEPLNNLRVSLYNDSGGYTFLSSFTDESGLAYFSLPEKSFTAKVTHKSFDYWSAPFTWESGMVAIPHGDVELTVISAGQPAEGAVVNVYSETGTKMNISGTTDINGKVTLAVPAQGIQLEVVHLGVTHWSDPIQVIPYELNTIEVDLDLLAQNLLNDPHPKRFDGTPPEYLPRVAYTGSLSGLFSQSATVTDPRAYYYIADHLNTAQLLVDEQGGIVWQGEFKPFGGVDIIVNKLENNFRFPGQYFDSETGLYYNWHRFYDPEIGRYISADPIGLQGGINLYAYVLNDPLNAVDPWGLEAFLIRQFVNRTVRSVSNSYMQDINPAGRRIISSGLGGAAAGAVGGAIVGTPVLGIGAGPSAVIGGITGFSGGLLIQTGLEAAGLGQAIEDLTDEVINNFQDAIIDTPNDGQQPCK